LTAENGRAATENHVVGPDGDGVVTILSIDQTAGQCHFDTGVADRDIVVTLTTNDFTVVGKGDGNGGTINDVITVVSVNQSTVDVALNENFVVAL